MSGTGGSEPLTTEEMEWLAADYAAGLLDGEPLMIAMRCEQREPIFARLVDRYRAALDAELLAIEPVEPPADLLDRIEGAPIPVPVAANDNGMRWWRMGALGSSAIAAALALLLIGNIARPPLTGGEAPVAVAQAAPLFAQVNNSDGETLVLLRFDAASGRLVARLVNAPAGAAVPELWVIPADGRPRSLGQVATPRRDVEIPIDQRALLIDGATIAVSLEPASPTGHTAPTGPVVGTATISTI